MARKLRIEFAGAIYHVLNRGNYRRDLFLSSGEAKAFVLTLEEATKIFGWRVQSYAVMRNHYHIALQTPQPNLVDGMHWLQSTFATRFNRFHGERGHLFQGRYQSLLVEDDASLARLVNYIHLNPVRAGIVTPDQVAAFRWSSLGRFMRSDRFPGLEAGDWLRAMGLADEEAGWSVYWERLHQLALDPAEQDRLGFAAMSRGWAIGSDNWRKAVASDHAHLAIHPGLAAAEARALREQNWTACLARLLVEAGRTDEDAKSAAKSAPWKVALAARLRAEAGASITWISASLHMGNPNAVRGYLSKASRRIDQ
ncbi:MAG: transposase [Burkholderiales bacterium]|nr:transposase [Opitutaceae bacterium]